MIPSIFDTLLLQFAKVGFVAILLTSETLNLFFLGLQVLDFYFKTEEACETL